MKNANLWNYILIYPSTLPDEVHIGYWGRFNRWNGLTKEADAIELLAARAALEKPASDDPGLIELLSFASSMSIREFVRLHTQQPYRRSIVSYKPDLVHGDERDTSMVRYSANRFVRRAAYFCATCVDADLVLHGTSYWRRSHQLPGMYVCPSHGDALCYIDSLKAFMKAPAVGLDDCHVIDSAWALENHENRHVQEFLRLSLALSEFPRPINLHRARAVLCGRAKVLNISVYPTKNNEYRLSDKIFSRYPGSWLELVFPKASAKSAGEIQHQLDGILYCSTSSSSIVAYLLGACVLFDTAEDFLHALAGATPAKRAKRGGRKDNFDRKIELHDGVASYIRCKGSHTKIAREYGAPMNAIKPQLLAFGLPDLGSSRNLQHSKQASALQHFYSRRMSLADSARLAGVLVEDIESLVRQAGIHLPAALRQMDLPDTAHAETDP